MAEGERVMSETAPKEQRDDRWASRDPSEVRAYYESHLEAAEREVERLRLREEVLSGAYDEVSAEVEGLRAERDEALRAASDNLHSFKLMEKSRNSWREASDHKLRRIEELSRERKELMTGVAVIVAAAGGEVRVPRRLLVDPPHEVQRVDDLVSDSVVFRVRQAQPTEGQERE